MAGSHGSTTGSRTIGTRLKTVENMPVTDWMSWGCQGYIVVGIYQGAGKITDCANYVPPVHQFTPTNPKTKNHIHTILVLGPIDSPSRECDNGWFHHQTPSKSNSSMHRVLHRWTPQAPIALSRGYGLGGGFSLMDPQDIDKICQLMSLNVLEAPGNSIFTGPTRIILSEFFVATCSPCQ